MLRGYCEGRFGEVLIGTHLFKLSCSNEKAEAEELGSRGQSLCPCALRSGD